MEVLIGKEFPGKYAKVMGIPGVVPGVSYDKPPRFSESVYGCSPSTPYSIIENQHQADQITDN